MYRLILATLILLGVAWPPLVTPTLAADVAVVCPPQFRKALQLWVDHRAAQGYGSVFVSAAGDAAKIQVRIQAASQDHELKAVLLIGDVDQSATATTDAKIICKIGDDKTIASDNCYGDLDGDGLPELAVGRLPADSPEELGVMIDKIIRYETAPAGGDWQRKINLIAGVGGFGVVADTALEVAARKFIVEGVPPEYCVSMTQASWRSPYFPDPRRFCETAIDRLSEGCLFWVYIGHGQRRHLDWVRTPDRNYYSILTAEDVPRIKARGSGAPIALFMACYTGAYDEPEDCLAEELLRQQDGPVAVLASTRASMPYAMGVMATTMMRQCFVERRQTIGEVFVEAKRDLVLGKRDDETSQSLDAMAKAISVNSDLAAEREEHVRLFNLLGDPLLRLAHPRPVSIKIEGKATPGGTLQISGECDLNGDVTVELVLRRDRLTFRRPYRPEYDASEESLRSLQEIYEQANDPRLAVVKARAVKGCFAATLQIPETAHGECHIRVTVNGMDGFASGAEAVRIR